MSSLCEQTKRRRDDSGLHEQASFQPRFDTNASVHEGAFLLQQVYNLALAEMHHDLEGYFRALEMLARRYSVSTSVSGTTSEITRGEDSTSESGTRIRAVSMSSQSLPTSSPPLSPLFLSLVGIPCKIAVQRPLSPPPLMFCPQSPQVSSVLPQMQAQVNEATSPTVTNKFEKSHLDISLPLQGKRREHTTCFRTSTELKTITSDQTAKSKRKHNAEYVGLKTPKKIKGVLQHKFSWKNFPELEEFILKHRDEYLHYSSAFNYTTKQKSFNNKLTSSFLEHASASGYMLEGFTFVQVRDRIRCYFKSHVQALKKYKIQSTKRTNPE